ncbi:alpha-L-fucosidase [bacterium]|nr:alpha-L-fucosidase [bacterium]
MEPKFSPLAIAMVFLFCAISGTLQSADIHEKDSKIIKLWESNPPEPNMELPPEVDTTKPGGNLVAGRRVIRTGNVSTPTLTVHRPEQGKANGTSILICPGGGHHILAWDLEGMEVAEWLNDHGVTAFILKYRVPSRERDGRRWISAVQDAQRAVSLIRQQADQWEIDPERIGILGFSAGGETAALTALLDQRQYESRDTTDDISHLPNFSILIYSAGLVNKDKTGLPNLVKVTKNSPPMFLAHAFDDGVPVEGCLFLMQALKREGVASELHVYSQGGHGYGLRETANPVTTWHHRCADWMRIQGWLSKPSKVQDHSSTSATPPAPYGVLPSERQVAWHQMEFYGFLHFSINTYTDREWGGGEEPPSKFDPTAFDADQIAKTAADAGMRALILTCKHHDGFSLWPSKHTEHSVKNSPFRDGKGDVVREISNACRNQGLKFGVYLSPWDRNHAEYGRPAYIDYFRAQLNELLTEYGPICEVWFDGANGGTGYYGGANERRNIDSSTYYDWENTWAMVRKLQPQAVMFSDVGPDVRWVGNERGIAGDPCWATYTPHGLDGAAPSPGKTQYKEGENGHRDGKYWIPAEVDVSIRPGWFYHANQDDKVRSPQNLVDLYYQSVGRGASFLLNLPPDPRGIIHEKDVAALRGFRTHMDATFSENLVKDAKLKASNTRDHSTRIFGLQKLIDGNRDSYWATDDEVHTPWIEVNFGKEASFNVVDIREHLPLGLRVDRWALDRWDNKESRWIEFATGEGIGNRRLWRGKTQSTFKLRLRIVEAPVCPALSEFGVYAAPNWQE